MIEINLLPKNYLKGSGSISLGKVGVYGIAAAAGIIMMLAGITFYQMYQIGNLEANIDKANQRAATLQRDIRLVDALSDVKGKIQDRMTAVEKLDRNRSVWVRILEDFSRNVPEFVWLARYQEQEPPRQDEQEKTGKKAKGKEKEAPPPPAPAKSGPDVRQVEIEGYAFTLNALASFMINMMRSDYFDQVELVSSTETKFNTDREKAYNFVVAASVHYLSDEDMQRLIAAAQAEKASGTDHKQLN